MNKRKSFQIIKFLLDGRLLIVILTWFTIDFLIEVALHADTALDKIVISSAQTTGWFVFATTFIIFIIYISALINEEKLRNKKRRKNI